MGTKTLWSRIKSLKGIYLAKRDLPALDGELPMETEGRAWKLAKPKFC